MLLGSLVSGRELGRPDQKRDDWLSKMRKDPDFRRTTVLFGFVLLAASLWVAADTAWAVPWHEALARTALASIIASPVLVVWATLLGAHGMTIAERLLATESGRRLDTFVALRVLESYVIWGISLAVFAFSEGLAGNLIRISEQSWRETLFPLWLLLVLAGIPPFLWISSGERRLDDLRRSFVLVGDSVSSPLATLIAWLATRMSPARMSPRSWLTRIASESRPRVLLLGVTLIVTGLLVQRASASDRQRK